MKNPFRRKPRTGLRSLTIKGNPNSLMSKIRAGVRQAQSLRMFAKADAIESKENKNVFDLKKMNGFNRRGGVLAESIIRQKMADKKLSTRARIKWNNAKENARDIRVLSRKLQQENKREIVRITEHILIEAGRKDWLEQLKRSKSSKK